MGNCYHQQFQFSVENIDNFNDFDETIDISNDFEETIENFNGFEETIENCEFCFRIALSSDSVRRPLSQL